MSTAEETPEETRQTDESDGAADARFELAAQIRRLITSSVAGRLSDEEMRRAAGRLCEVADRLDSAAAPGRSPRYFPDPEGDPQDFFSASPVIGFANPVAPPVLLKAHGGELRGSAWFDYQYEGPPGYVHGGVIAKVFDELLGSANILAGHPAMTGTLTIRYRRPTPLRAPIRMEARFVSRNGRRIKTYAAMYHEDTLTAEADGVFVSVPPKSARAAKPGPRGRRGPDQGTPAENH